MTFFLSSLQTQSTKQVAGVEVIKQAKEGPADGSSSDTDDSNQDRYRIIIVWNGCVMSAM